MTTGSSFPDAMANALKGRTRRGSQDVNTPSDTGPSISEDVSHVRKTPAVQHYRNLIELARALELSAVDTLPATASDEHLSALEESLATDSELLTQGASPSVSQLRQAIGKFRERQTQWAAISISVALCSIAFDVRSFADHQLDSIILVNDLKLHLTLSARTSTADAVAAMSDAFSLCEGRSGPDSQRAFFLSKIMASLPDKGQIGAEPAAKLQAWTRGG